MPKSLLGYSQKNLSAHPYAGFYNPELAPLQAQVQEALLIGEQAQELFPSIEHAASMSESGYWPVETGYTTAPDTSIRVFCLTKMPKVSPIMWDWWFGWHGCEAHRYKLWHPKAHVDARWQDGARDERYIGRTSLITEYLGANLKKAAISFIPPAQLGFNEQQLESQGEVVICARVGLPNLPLKGGWLVHQIRPVPGGSEMRSRMWLGGDNNALSDKPNSFARAISRALRPVSKLILPNPSELLVHNAQEMAHLAGFLPDLYSQFGQQSLKET